LGEERLGRIPGLLFSNRMDQDETSRVGGGDQEMKVLTEMNELQEFENENWSRNGRD